ncbi:universal stress protein (plasmid) [Roseomonas mucosa]|nr:universal stress protein [Roseomonas mucosa]
MQAYRSIMVHVPIGPGGDAHVALAADLADRCNARLTGIAAGCLRMPLATADGGAALAQIVASGEEDLQEALHAAAGRFRAGLSPAMQDAAWRAFAEPPALALTREACGADLLVLGRREDSATARFHCSADAGDLLMGAGRPVLVVPPQIRRLEARRAVVAWTDTRESRRAVADAVPLLQQCENVRVLEICGHADAAAPAARRTREVAGYLRQHGIKAAGDALQLGEATIADQLLAALELVDGDLIVAGGYGHTRLREWIFGGVTQALIRRAPCCCLLSR